MVMVRSSGSVPAGSVPGYELQDPTGPLQSRYGEMMRATPARRTPGAGEACVGDGDGIRPITE